MRNEPLDELLQTTYHMVDARSNNRPLRRQALICSGRPSKHPVSWLRKIFKGDSARANSPEEVVRFYQGLGFFAGDDPVAVVQRYIDEHGAPPDPGKPWDDVFLLAYAEGDVWADDPEADVCADNQVYSAVLPEWARISHGAFAPRGVTEHWDDESGPITLSFELGGQPASVSPRYQDDWIDLEVLRQMNALITLSRRRFECAVDGNFALVLCLTPEQKATMQTQRQFPFAW